MKQLTQLTRRKPGSAIALIAFMIGISGAGILLDAKFDAASSSTVKLHVRKVLDLRTPGVGVAVAWSADGSKLAAASDYGAVISIWSRNGRLINRFFNGGEGPILSGSIGFTPRSDELIFPSPPGAVDNTAFGIWNIKTGKVVGTVQGPPSSKNWVNAATKFDSTSDQTILVASSGIAKPNVAIYRMQDWQLLQTAELKDGVFALNVFDEGKLATVGSVDGGVTIFDTDNPNRLVRLRAYKRSGFGSFITGAVAGSPDGAFVLVGLGLPFLNGPYVNSAAAKAWLASQPAVRVLRMKDGLEVASLKGPRTPIRDAAWADSGAYVAFTDAIGGLYLWRPFILNDKPQKMSLEDSALSVAISADSRYVAVTSNEGVSIFKVQ